MYNMENSPACYYQIERNYKEAQLLFTAINMDIFSYMDVPATAGDIATSLNLDSEKIELFLKALVSCGLIRKLDNLYVNTPESKDFLSRNSDVFLGETILFREQMTSLDDLESKIRGIKKPYSSDYDFATLAKLSIPEMYTGRVQAFRKEISTIFPDRERPLRMLDLGGGNGILSIEFAKSYSYGKATVFDVPEVSEVTKKIIERYKAGDSVDIISGDFNVDDLGGKYDLIVASGVLNFVKGGLPRFFAKLSTNLHNGGYLFVVGQYLDSKYCIPLNMTSWLSGFLNGIPLPPCCDEVRKATEEVKLRAVDISSDSIFGVHLYRKETAEEYAKSDDVVSSFIELTEQTANSKTNILDFGSPEMTFHRGEIHMIKMIGDFPGIYSAELARKFGITRPVVHKTLQKLSERGLVKQTKDKDDQKRQKLYLTEEGCRAYSFHEKYHAENDKALICYLANLSDKQLTIVKNFLDHAIALIGNHA